MSRGDRPGSRRRGHHLRRELLDGYFLGRVGTVDLLARTADHLTGRCRECRRTLGSDPGRYRKHLEAAAARLRARAEELSEERARVPQLLADLGKRTGVNRYVAVLVEPRFHTSAFVKHQLDAGWQAVRHGDLAAGREALELATAAALGLPVDRYGRTVRLLQEGDTELLRARLCLAEGNDEAAERALETAAHLAAQVGCSELRAGVFLGRGSLHLARGDGEAAEEALRSAAAVGASAWRSSVAEALAHLGIGSGERPEPRPAKQATWEGVRHTWRRQAGRGLRHRLIRGVADLARRITARAPAAERSAALRELAAMCQELVAGPPLSRGTDLPGPLVAELARFTRRLLSGRVDAEEIRAFEDAVLRLHPPWGPPTMRHDRTGGRFPTDELTELLAKSSHELRSILVAHGLSDREIEEVLQDATMALLERWHGLDDRRGWLLDRVRRLCRQAAGVSPEDEVN